MRLTKKQKASITAILELRERLSTPARWLVQDAYPDANPGYQAKLTEQCIRQYQRFLVMRLLNPDRPLYFDRALGLWRKHILDTRAYRADCEAIFGAFLDHDPDGRHDAHLHAADTWQLYLETFSSGRWGRPPAILKPLELTEEEAGTARAMLSPLEF